MRRVFSAREVEVGTGAAGEGREEVCMALEEKTVTACIMRSFFEDFLRDLEVDVVIAGAGPSGVTAARYLAQAGVRTVVFEKNLHVGGGMWGGGMLFPRIVVQEGPNRLLEEVGVRLQEAEDGLYVADSVQAVACCTAAAIRAGARIWVGMSVEDLVIREDHRVCGVVLNWTAVEKAGLHVDPLAVSCRLVIDATGHEAQVCRTLVRKVPGLRLLTRSGEVEGELPMWAERGEEALVDNTRQVHPGLLVAGMAANAVFGSPRMGAVFGGMLLSGKRAAELAVELLRSSK